MPDLPGWLLTHTATVEPLQGQSGTGPLWGAAVTVPCFVDQQRKLARDQDNREVVASTRLYCRLSEPVTPGSRVTVNGRASTVLTVTRYDGSGLPVPSHLEVAVE